MLGCLDFFWKRVHKLVIFFKSTSSWKIKCENWWKLLKPKKIKNSVAASDAFFPFSDGIKTLIKAGVRIIIQPGGSIRDQEVIKVANKAKIKMLFTGIRHFKH